MGVIGTLPLTIILTLSTRISWLLSVVIYAVAGWAAVTGFLLINGEDGIPRKMEPIVVVVAVIYGSFIWGRLLREDLK